MTAILGTLAGKLGMAVAGLALLIGAYAWITTGAYNRGHDAGSAEMAAKMAKVIAAERKTATENMDKWKAKTPGERTSELKRRCVQACDGEPLCVKACQ